MKVILLAAGVGRRFGARTRKTPKCLIPLGKNGPTLLSRYLDSFRAIGLKNVVVVCGHQKEKIKKECLRSGGGLNIRFLFNRDYRKGSVVSLHRAAGELTDDCLIMDADVYFPTAALKRLVRSRHSAVFLIDTRSKSTGEEMMLMAKGLCPVRISKQIDPRLDILGESVGFLKIGAPHARLLARILKDFIRKGRTNVEYEETYNVLMKKNKVGFEKINGFFWTEMDFEEDLEKILKRETPANG